MKDVLKALAQSYAELPKRSEFAAALKALSTVVARFLADVDRRVNARLATIRNGRDGKDGKKGDKGDRGAQGESIQGRAGEPGRDGKDGSPDTAEDIRNKLELFIGEPEDDKLKIDAIGFLAEKLEDLEQRIKSGGGHHTFAVQRGQLKVYDLSEQLDGMTATFLLPAFWRVISVQSTSTPGIFRPTVDYTADASVPSITFTSQIDATTTLAPGQTLLVIYAEP